jgi:histidine triad (HIT) family protein
MDCIFCRIIADQIPGDIIYQDKELVAFRDIHPVAPTHVLIVPKKHIPDLVHLSEADLPVIARMVKAANQLAKQEGISQSGYRLVINCGTDAGQVVPHLHMHLLGGRRLVDGLA